MLKVREVPQGWALGCWKVEAWGNSCIRRRDTADETGTGEVHTSAHTDTHTVRANLSHHQSLIRGVSWHPICPLYRTVPTSSNPLPQWLFKPPMFVLCHCVRVCIVIMFLCLRFLIYVMFVLRRLFTMCVCLQVCSCCFIRNVMPTPSIFPSVLRDPAEKALLIQSLS